MIKKYLTFMTVSLITLALSPSPALAKGKKSGTYVGGKGSSHKGGQYAPPPGQRYKKKN